MSIRDNIFNCPNCGAPISSDSCPYCDTAFIDWSCIDDRKPNWIKVRLNGKIVLIKAYLKGISTRYEPPEPAYFYTDTKPYYEVMSDLGELEIDSTLVAVPFQVHGQKNPALSVVIDTEVADLQVAGELLHNTQH